MYKTIIFLVLTSAFFCPECDLQISCNSDSMGSTLDCEDILLGVMPLSKWELSTGNIIIYKKPDNSSVIHRIVGIDPRGCYITKGDNNKRVDKYHPCYDDIKYKIIYIVKKV